MSFVEKLNIVQMWKTKLWKWTVRRGSIWRSRQNWEHGRNWSQSPVKGA
jgi:hypothetical protein